MTCNQVTNHREGKGGSEFCVWVKSQILYHNSFMLMVFSFCVQSLFQFQICISLQNLKKRVSPSAEFLLDFSSKLGKCASLLIVTFGYDSILLLDQLLWWHQSICASAQRMYFSLFLFTFQGSSRFERHHRRSWRERGKGKMMMLVIKIKTHKCLCLRPFQNILSSTASLFISYWVLCRSSVRFLTFLL